ncbi:MAG: SDR family oxidoreductase [Myxococcota bacterium]|nr:SDR family oxidoreductase [Myxococcota bacterium]
MNHYRGKKIFITGGSSGIGEAAARLLAGWGADVWIGARGEARLATALDGIRAVGRGGGQILGRTTIDVSDTDSVAAAAAEVLEGLGGLDLLINNAGIAHPATALETPDEIYESMMRVNYFGTVNVTRAFLPHFYAQKRGHICNVGSMLGFMGIYGYTAYAASKYAITGFSDCLRQELLDHGVGITVVFPPDTDTPQLAAENEIKPPETKAIAGEVKMMSAEAVARSMLGGVASGKYHVVPGLMGGLTYWAYRHVPWLVRLVIDGALKSYRKKHPLT